MSASAGEPYCDRLLALPQFLLPGRKAALAPGDVAKGFALTGHFLETRVMQPRGEDMSEARARMIGLVHRSEGDLGSPARHRAT